MPYYISNTQERCKNRWAVIKENRELLGCHTNKQAAIAQMVALSLAEGIEPGGDFAKRNKEADTYSPPEGVQSAAKRALKWISEGKAGSGFTDVGRRRASQLARGGPVSRDTVVRMKSYFARHVNDKQATGFYSGEKGFPSPGRVAWDAWGGDAGRTWVNNINLDN